MYCYSDLFYNNWKQKSCTLFFFSAGDVSPTNQENCVEQWLEWLTYLISERQRHFVVDYNAVFPVQDDIDLMTQLNMAMYKFLVEFPVVYN